MVLCNVDCLEKISNYLDVPPPQLEMHKNTIAHADQASSQNIEGFSTIVQCLIQSSKCSDILGDNSQVEALSRQWLEYAVVCVNHADTLANVKRILQELNTVLRDNMYVTGTKKTIADVTLYYALHSIMRELTHQEKALYVHVSRWFDNVQQEEKLRQQLDLISFDMLHLFL